MVLPSHVWWFNHQMQVADAESERTCNVLRVYFNVLRSAHAPWGRGLAVNLSDSRTGHPVTVLELVHVSCTRAGVTSPPALVCSQLGRLTPHHIESTSVVFHFSDARHCSGIRSRLQLRAEMLPLLQGSRSVDGQQTTAGTAVVVVVVVVVTAAAGGAASRAAGGAASGATSGAASGTAGRPVCVSTSTSPHTRGVYGQR